MAENEDQTALRLLAREVAAREVGPRAAHGDETGEVPTEAIKALAAADLFRVTIGEQWGGLGFGDVESSIVLEEVARHDVSTAICCQLAFNGPARGIEHLGNPALQDRWLPAVANGEAIVSIGITEPDAGSAVQSMRTALIEDGPGRWRLNGYKNFSTLGHAAAGVLVWCRWPGGDGAKGSARSSSPWIASGVSLAGKHRSMGIHAATEAEIAFDGVAVTEDDVLLAGDPSSTEAFKVLLSHLNHERCGNAAMCVGAAQGALEHATRYMNDRVIGGQPIASLQGLQWKLADMAIALEGRGSSWPERCDWPARVGRRRPWRRRWPRRQPTSRRSSCATRPSSCTAGTGTAASTRWSGSIGTSAGCASGRAPSRRNGTTSAPAWPRSRRSRPAG